MSTERPIDATLKIGERIERQPQEGHAILTLILQNPLATAMHKEQALILLGSRGYQLYNDFMVTGKSQGYTSWRAEKAVQVWRNRVTTLESQVAEQNLATLNIVPFRTRDAYPNNNA